MPPVIPSKETIDKRVQEISAIYEISQAHDNVPIDDLLQLVTRKAADVMDAQACSLMLKSPETNELVIKASWGLSTEIIEETRVEYGKGIAGIVAKTGHPMLLNNLQDDPRFQDSNVTPRPDIVSSISVPLRDEESRVQGVLSIRRTSPAAMFNEDDMKVFSVFASQAALAISNAQLYASLKERVKELSKQIELENEVRRIRELAAIGQLAANIAHEIRNPLSSIKGAAQFLRNEYEDHASIPEFLDIIIEEVNVLNSITTEFLEYARPSRLNLKKTDINGLVARTLQFMQIDIANHGVSINQSLACDLPGIYADERQVEQVFRNIILNAVQAMPEGGNLTVASRPTPQGAAVSFTDTGVGIPEDQLSEIFLPFFTTKTKGTGIGLAIVQKIVDSHGGKITVESKPGKGTCFDILLPVRSEKTSPDEIEKKHSLEEETDLFRRAQSRS